MADGVKFDIEKLFTYLVEKFHLADIALRDSIKIALTADGATLDQRHVTIGFMICDKRARYPVSGKLIFDEAREKENLQSAA
jgi:hypothetical protein